MIKQFYEKALPSQGVYCVAKIDNKRTTQRFAESIDDVENLARQFALEKANVYVALASFDGYSRKAEDAQFLRSFFIDLDVGVSKAQVKRGYVSKSEAHIALQVFLARTELPPPVIVDSGTGVHAYWLFDRDIPIAEWKPYAEKFKAYCLENDLHIDPVVTADVARIMRCPETFNYKTTPPSKCEVISDELPAYSFDEFKEFLGIVEETPAEILRNLPKGLDEDTKALMKLDNQETSFEKIAIRSIEGDGCEQIKWAIENSTTLPEPLWTATLSIAQHCIDRDEAIHKLSEDYPGYDAAETERKATLRQGKPYSCTVFDNENPGVCDTCKYKGKFTNPLALGRIIKIAQAPKEDAVRQYENPEDIPANVIPDHPQALFPYFRGETGGIYYQPPPKVDKKGNKTILDAQLIYPHELFPIRRMYSKMDGEILMMRLLLPKDAPRDFMITTRSLNASDEFKKAIGFMGIVGNAGKLQHIMGYIMKWGHYLQTQAEAELMQMQMGWTEPVGDERLGREYVIGNSLIKANGKIVPTPASPMVRSVAKHFEPKGSFEVWRECAQQLNRPTMEMHGFGTLIGLGSPLMPLTSTPGAVVSYTGKSGNGKTGALYANLSVWCNPVGISVFDATNNGLNQRYITLKNAGFGVDEAHTRKLEELSKMVHAISQGKAKIRMQGSINAEREHELLASAIAMMTCNVPLLDMIMSNNSMATGEMARMIEFLVMKPQLLIDEPSFGPKVFDLFKYNYGHAARKIIPAYFTHGEVALKQMVDEWIARFKRDFGNDAIYRFYENIIGATMAGGMVANEFGIIEYDLERIYSKVCGEMINLRDKVVNLGETDYSSLVGDFINKYYTGILGINDGKVTMEPRTSLVGRIDLATGLVTVSTTEFKKYLTEKSVSSREFEQNMREKKILVDVKKSRLDAGWKQALSILDKNMNVNTYVFATQIPDSFFTPDGHGEADGGT
jgi:hypothetical protein